MTNDLVSDMLTRIRNASLAKHSFTKVNYSKLNLAILKVLEAEGYINTYELENETSIKKAIRVNLKYKGSLIALIIFKS
jgi:small subunit ribosomal protein S8